MATREMEKALTIVFGGRLSVKFIGLQLSVGTRFSGERTYGGRTSYCCSG